MELNIHDLSPEVRETLERCVSYGWRPAVAAKILNCQFGFSLVAKDVSKVLAELTEIAKEKEAGKTGPTAK